MVDRPLTPTEREQLSAYLDGQLGGEEAAAVAARIAGDPRWRAAAGQYGRLDAVLGRWTAPRMRRDLTAAILAEARRTPPRPAWFRWLVPLAAAASIVVAVMLSIDEPAPRLAAGPPPSDPLERVVQAMPQEDRFVVENLDIFADYDVLENFDTLEALAALEREQPGT
ncbi:MAG: hypothetical protein GX591_00770 [Planctomycetes bacterium]|nr:hypothetical protein [Planctomycetota bacterium]